VKDTFELKYLSSILYTILPLVYSTLPRSVVGIIHSHLEQQIVKDTFEVNYFGVVRVSKAFIPLVKKAKQGVIVNVSSGLGSITGMTNKDGPYYKYQAAGYNASKSALNMYTVALSAVLGDVRIFVFVFVCFCIWLFILFFIFILLLLLLFYLFIV
jgi:NAD(P)-dependent dehydrogenase (short-subunit alcohol dehydrogenase family)